MKILNGKITCTGCNGKGASLEESCGKTTVLKCKSCGRKVECDTVKIGDSMFDKASMEGKSLNYAEVENEL